MFWSYFHVFLSVVENVIENVIFHENVLFPLLSKGEKWKKLKIHDFDHEMMHLAPPRARGGGARCIVLVLKSMVNLRTRRNNII